MKLLLQTGLALSLATVLQAQTPVIYYNFNSGTANAGSGGGTGTLNGVSSTAAGPGGAGSFSGGNVLSLDGADGSYLATGLGAAATGFSTANYTASAWVNLASIGGDSMVFGQLTSPHLHDGVRGANQHLGHWGADSTGSTALSANTWYHLTWRVENGRQTLFIGGNYETAPNALGTLTNTDNIVVGTSGNGGGLPGFLDDVVVYNSALTRNQIAALAGGGSPLALPAANAAPGMGLTGALGAHLGAQGSNQDYQTANTWGVTEVRANGGVGNILNAVRSIDSGTGTISSGTASVISKADNGAANSTGQLFGLAQPYVGDTTGVDEDNIAFIYKSKITAPAGGTYTFNVHSDDGFALKVGNQVISAVSGAGAVDFDDNTTVMFTGGTGDSNTRAVINLPAGVHDVEFITFEGGGGSGHELTYAPGSNLNTGDTVNWRLLGDTDSVKNIPSVSAAGWTVTTSAAGGTPIANRTDGLADLAATGTTQTGVASINYTDPGGSASASAGQVGGDSPFANDVALADEDHFAVSATATLKIDTADVYRFGLHSDDGGAFRIVGQTGWTNLRSGGAATIAGDTVIADFATGDANTFADISLAPGDYSIEVMFFEITGGGNFEFLAGDASFGGSGSQSLQLLMAGTPQSIAVDTLYLGVPEPGAASLLALAGLGLLRRRRTA